MAHWDHASRSQIEEFVAQLRGSDVRVELLRPSLDGPRRRAY
ncbi:hypothetical protein [Streptomyces sp. NPDC001970]